MKTDISKIKIAIVADPIDKNGGLEQVMLNLLKEFPQADVYTARSDSKVLKEQLYGLKVRNSFIHYIPFEKYFRKELYLLYPWAYQTFSFLGYDIVISNSVAFGKYIKPWSKKTKHIAYIATPPRFFWMHDVRSMKSSDRPSFKFYSFFISTFLEKIWQYWDRKAARRADKIVTISKEIQGRVKKFYGLESEVIYPSVNVKDIPYVTDPLKKENWFLYLGRVETYKGVELAIRACVEAKKPLKVVGAGSDLERMIALVKELNAKGIVKFIDRMYTDEEKYDLLKRAKALLFPVQEEDFGIIPVEANAAGTAVIAHRSGGPLETISESNPKTGVFFDEYDYKALAKKITEFDVEDYDPKNCRKQASNYATEIFRYKFRNLVADVYESSNKGN